MSAFQDAFDRLRRAQEDFEATKAALSKDASRLRQLVGRDLDQANQAEGSCELTYLMRLLSDFEGTVIDLSPHLTSALVFDAEDGLSSKINGIGKRMGMPRGLRERVHSDVRLLRNDLMHGRSAGLAVDFDGAHRLMKEFLRACR